MKFYQSSHTFQHPWSTVTQAFWRKYPNDYQSVVYGTDVLERFVDSEGRLHSKRIIISDWNLPSFMTFFFGDTRAYAVEYSIVDPVQKTLTLRSRNINAASMFTMQEEIAYRSTGETTSLQHEAKILISASRIFDDRAEDYIVGTITEAACKGLKGMDSIIDTVETEMASALTALDDISTETMRSVDEFATDAIRTIDSSILDAEKFIDSSIDYIIPTDSSTESRVTFS